MRGNTQYKRMLIVDDDPIMTKLLVMLIGELGNGYVIETTNSSEEALVRIQQAMYALVLTDYEMPGVNGLELAQAVRQLSPDTRVVLMTGYDTAKLRDTAERLALDGYINKPFTISQLREIF